MRGLLAVLTVGLLALSCNLAPRPTASGGVLDLCGFDWSRNTVDLVGEWLLDDRPRNVPDAWKGDEAGGPDGRGSGTYRLRLKLSPDAPPMALHYRTASTAMRIVVNGKPVAEVGRPDSELSRAQSAFAPGTVRLEPSQELNLEVFVSNPVYRIGGLWEAPTLGTAERIEFEFWRDQAVALILGSVLGVIGFASLLLFAFRQKEKTLLFLGLFAFLVAFRSVVTGDYVLARLFPWLGFDPLIRLEYLTAFLPLPAAVYFFSAFFPKISGPLVRRLLSWPSLFFGFLTLSLPLDLLTRAITLFYPIAIPSLIVATVLLIKTVASDARGHRLLLAGAVFLAVTGLCDMLSAALFFTTGKLVPWGLEVFVILQATTLARRFLESFETTETLLAAKNQMVSEIHHRVKNSLQIVASLVSLQARRTPDPETKAVFAALRMRMTAISLVHEKLYGQGASGRPDLIEYLKELVALQYPSDNLTGATMTWEADEGPLAADIDYCIDTGLILTELVGNAHRHGIAFRESGRWSVGLRHQAGWLILCVADDGPGFPSQFDPSQAKGLGFRLILTLLTRHEGTLALEPGPGARVEVKLRLGEPKLSGPG